MNKKTVLFLLSFALCGSALWAKISFNALDLNNSDKALFTVTHQTTGTSGYSTLLCADLKNGSSGNPSVLTVYPEQLDVLHNGTVLQIRNQFGTARYSLSENSLKWEKQVSGLPANILKAKPYSVSPDGEWFCKIEKTGLCTGNLILENVTTGENVVLNTNVLDSYDELPVKWAPDSSVLLYEKNSSVYFCKPDALIRGVEIDELYRKIGRGNIKNVYWSSSKYLAYVDDYILYRINAKELYTTGLYSDIIGRGKAMGRLPFQYDPQRDSFSTNNDSTALLVVQDRRLFTYLQIRSMALDYMDVLYSYAYNDASASLVDAYVFWDVTGQPVIWQEKLPYDGGAERGSVYTIKEKTCTQVLEIENSGKPFIGPDRSKIAFWSDDTVYVYDINNWQRTAELGGEQVTTAVWINRNALFVGGEKSLRRWNLITGGIDLITLSSVEQAYWYEENKIVASSGGNNYVYDSKNGTWKAEHEAFTVYPQTQNGRYRIYTGTTPNKRFENSIYVRSLTGKAVTKPVYAETAKKAPEPLKVALVFDAYDNADGLPRVLYTLKKYNLKADFFINGEFIRRYPQETNQLVLNGYEAASMFFTTSLLTDEAFSINEEYILRGLARTEDEFYACTGSELSLYWHAPYYKITEDYKQYGKDAGYEYSEICVKHTEFDGMELSQLINEYLSCVEKNKGGIVPVTVGFSESGHTNPLYKHLELIIGTLVDEGYELVLLNQL